MRVSGDDERALPRTSARLLAVNGLGLYVMLMYGITYYAVTTAAPRMAAEFGYPTSSIFAVITVSLLATAALAPRLGRLSDQIGASTILLVGALLRAVLLAGMALAPEELSFALALLLVQILGQVTEYDATFAATVELSGVNARSGMSQITLWGGLASTAFWPATTFLLERMHWRNMLLIYAAVILLVCVPIAALVRTASCHRRQPDATNLPASGGSSDSKEPVPPAPPPFWLVAAAFALGGVAYNLPYLMLPVLEGLGLGASAVIVAMVFGPSQTAGRFFDMVLGDRVRAVTVAVAASAMVAISFAVLLTGGVATGIAFAVLFGAGAGVGYVVRGSVMLALYGAEGYAASLGQLGRIRLLVTALAPLGLAIVLDNLGARAVIYVCAAAALLSLACFATLSIFTRSNREANRQL
ncbi:MAG: hypothetical protein C0465_26550 [Ralstonia sp.]|uniref:MFS transporter n=1 Tax=Ralstonia sp. TaxID=54061 RepID=UPI00257BDEB3|nr:MFS transporter [Ralstonia sp.]MBA4234136.1 hypothetical protein [Ralstonia sp.]